MNQTIMREVLTDFTKLQPVLQSIYDRKRKVMLFMNGCRKLPDDIIRKIYEDYLKPEMIYEDLIQILQSQSSRRLYSVTLTRFIPKVLGNKILLEFLLSKDQLFREIYGIHIINNTKEYRRSETILDSMAMSWLAYLYH